MDKIELVKGINDWTNSRVEDYYADGFQLISSSGPPFDKDATLMMRRLMKEAMPDIKTIIDDLREDGDDVLVTSHWEGTFTNDFDLSALGMGVVPATGKLVVFPTASVRVSFEGDKISKVYDPATGPDAGVAGFVKALGVEMG